MQTYIRDKTAFITMMRHFPHLRTQVEGGDLRVNFGWKQHDVDLVFDLEGNLRLTFLAPYDAKEERRLFIECGNDNPSDYDVRSTVKEIMTNEVREVIKHTCFDLEDGQVEEDFVWRDTAPRADTAWIRVLQDVGTILTKIAGFGRKSGATSTP